MFCECCADKADGESSFDEYDNKFDPKGSSKVTLISMLCRLKEGRELVCENMNSIGSYADLTERTYSQSLILPACKDGREHVSSQKEEQKDVMQAMVVFCIEN